MDLLEYQAKDLFKGISIPTLPSQLITHVGEVKNLTLNYPLMLKSQVKSGGRAQAGGIRYVDNTIDAIAQTQAILNLPIWGEYPQLIMVEPHYQSYQEIFLAVVMDYWLGKPMLLGSRTGGTNIDPLLANLERVIVDRPFSPYLAKKLTILMGLESHLINRVADLISKMYELFVQFDLDLIEINPLGVDREDNLMALDGKIRINQAAWHRQINYFQPMNGDLAAPRETEKKLSEPVWTGNEEHGLVIITNAMGLAMVSWDLAMAKNIPLNSCFALGKSTLQESLAQLLISLEQEGSPGMVMLYLWGNDSVAEEVRGALATYRVKANFANPAKLPPGLTWHNQENLIICCPHPWSLHQENDEESSKIERFQDLRTAFERVARAYEIMA